MNNIKHVITDMDGTIVPNMQHVVSDRVRQAIIDVEEQDVVVSVVTARPYELAENALIVLGVEGPSVFDGGATVANAKTGEILWKKWLDVERLQQVVDIVLPYASSIDYTPGYNQISVPTDKNIPAAVEDSAYVFAIVEMSNYDTILDQLAQVSDIVAHKITLYGKDDIVGIQVTDHQADKFHGVAALREIVGIGQEHTLAIGDGDNDLTLFKNAAVKVAMGNATTALRAAADVTVASLEHDGFAEAMEHFVLKPAVRSR